MQKVVYEHNSANGLYIVISVWEAGRALKRGKQKIEKGESSEMRMK